MNFYMCNKNELWQLSDQNCAAKNGAFRSPKMIIFLCRMFSPKKQGIFNRNCSSDHADDRSVISND